MAGILGHIRSTAINHLISPQSETKQVHSILPYNDVEFNIDEMHSPDVCTQAATRAFPIGGHRGHSDRMCNRPRPPKASCQPASLVCARGTYEHAPQKLKNPRHYRPFCTDVPWNVSKMTFCTDVPWNVSNRIRSNRYHYECIPHPRCQSIYLAVQMNTHN